MDTFWAYFNGNWVSDSELKIAVDDVGFLVGATITERLRTFRADVFRLEQHLKRLHRSLEIVGLDGDEVVAQVASAIPEFVQRNSDRIAFDDDWSIVAFVTPGITGSAVPTICVHGYPLPFEQWADKYDQGVAVAVSSIRQVPTNCWPPELKCRSRMHYYLADQQANTMRPGARAILLDQNGYVAEATTANVLVYQEGEGLVSPPGDNILAGVSLDVVSELARRLNIPFHRRNITVEDLSTASELLLCSTSVCLLPIVECDAKPTGIGRPGPIYQRLLTAWSKLVGIDIVAQARQFRKRKP